MLNIVCGLIAAKHIASDKVRTNVILKDIYIDLLFNNRVWPPNWGLYFKIPDNNKIHKYNCAAVMPMTANSEVKAMEYLINNFKFYLVLGKPDKPEASDIHRLHKLIFSNGTIQKILN